MGRSEKSKQVKKENVNEGTAARTRPFSFEEIMLRRQKKLTMVNFGKSDEIKKLSGKDDNEGTANHSAFVGVQGKSGEPSDAHKEKSGKHEGRRSKKVGGYPDDKLKRDGQRSRYTRSVIEKESGKEKLTQQHDRDDWAKSTKKLYEKKISRGNNSRNKHEDRDRTPIREGKRKPYGHIDEKDSADFDDITLKKPELGRPRVFEHSGTHSGKQVLSRAYGELRSKRKRSRSLDYIKERVGWSPRSRKYSYHEGDYGDSSSYKEKKRAEDYDVDKSKHAGNGEHGSSYYRKRGSGLGGYSPRKRRTEAVNAVHSSARSPERKSATWDIPPSGNNNSGSLSIKMPEMAASTPVKSDPEKPHPLPILDIPLQVVNPSIDSIQLTQQTRPMRRLYIENLPVSTSEKSLTDSLNEFLLSFGINHIQGTKPCISCIINKEKCQALVEFLTPQDATAALSFDGTSFSGAVLKIRRPKDFVEPATTGQEKAEAVDKLISDVVEDTPYKIFIGGISKFLSSSMLLEIVSAFGPISAYRFDFNSEVDGPCAFLQYVDHDITLKACAGLNGMRLGGKVLTVVRANSDSCIEEDTEGSPSYSIPSHAKPLLANPTQVLQIENMFNEEEFLQCSESDLQEMLEDIRLECARFGTVKSLNVVGYGSNIASIIEANCDCTETESKDLGVEGENVMNRSFEVFCKDALEVSIELPTSESLEYTNAVNAAAEFEITDGVAHEGANEDGTVDTTFENELVFERPQQHGVVGVPEDGLSSKIEVSSGATPGLFNPGCVLVEFTRSESSCLVAHALHGRVYGERVVTVRYAPHDLYITRFQK